MKDTMKKVNRAGCIILFLTSLGAFTGCNGVNHKPFELFDEATVIKNGTIAVISADNSETTVRLTEALTNELRERSSFKVWSQAKINLRIPKYPITIREGQPENPDKPVWFGKGEKARVDAMQAQLKVQYLFVVWTGLSRSSASASYHVSVSGNVVEYPKGRVIGYSLLPSGSRQSKSEDINPILKDSAVMMAERFIIAAKAEKPTKEKLNKESL
jgi:hypothetical protein